MPSYLDASDPPRPRGDRLARSFVSAVVVVLADVAIVAYVVCGPGAGVPSHLAEHALLQQGGLVGAPPMTSTSTPPTAPRGPITTVAPATTTPPVPSSTTATRPVPITQPPTPPTSPATTTPSSDLPVSSLDEPAVPLLTLADPVANIPPPPQLVPACGSPGSISSGLCEGLAINAINVAHAAEGLAPMTLPSNWASLTSAQQLFVASNLERTVRGLQPLSAMDSALDGAATQAAMAGADPAVPTGFSASESGGNWAAGASNALEVLYYWMYDDGLGSPNIDCSVSDPDGCWGHRNNILLSLACTPCVGGVGWVIEPNGVTSATELVVEALAPASTDFTWVEEQPYLS